MEFAFRSRQAMEVADNVETGRLRRFSDLPPPPYGDSSANASPINAALARRREELLWELSKVRSRHDMILRELVETEHAMGFTAYNPVPTPPSSQDYWRNRTPPVNPFEEAPPPPQRSSAEGSPSVSGGPTAMRVPPVYPKVEWPPSPLLQPQPASDTEQQQGCRSSEATVMHPFDGYVELCRSSKKSTVAEEASVPAVTNDGARPTFGEVAPANKDVAGGEQKDGVKVAHGEQRLYEIGNQSSGYRKTAEITLMDQISVPMMSSDRYTMGGQESVAFHQQNRLEFSVLTPEQPRLGDGREQQQEEFRSSGLGIGAHVFSGYAELQLSPSKQAPVKETLVPVAAKVEEVASGHQQAFCGEPEADVNKSSGEERKAVESAMEDRTDEPARLPGQHRPAGLENIAYNEQKMVGFSKSVHESTSARVKRKLNEAASPSKKQKPLGKNSCSICNMNTSGPCQLAEHPGGKTHRSNVTTLQASRNGATDPHTEATPVRKTTMATNTKSLSINGKENVAGSSGSKQRGKPHLKSFAHRKDADAGKKVDWKSEFYCKLCDVQCTSEKMLASHLGGKKHRGRKLLEGKGSV